MGNKAIVKSVTPGSIADEIGLEAGDKIVKANNTEFTDILDFKFLVSDDYYTLDIETAQGTLETVEIFNDDYEELGAEFENQLIDTPKTCHNKCIFCFMDQLPPNMRETMYFKDDDVRLSFLQGNYVTLTNLKDEDIDRIIRLRISPINVSVHTTDPELRVKMLGNRFAGEVFEYMKRFSDAGLHVNAQIVLCPDINDGENLMHTLKDLASLLPNIGSVSIVPVGLSKHRDGLFELSSFTKETASATIDMVEKFQNELLEKYGTRLVYLADEFYVMAERDIPPYEAYEDFPQIENGVGMIASFEKEFYDALKSYKKPKNIKKKTIATGYIMYDFVKKYVCELGLSDFVNVYKIKNDFFGEKITVTGLLCGCDIINQLRGKELGDELILSLSMIKYDTELLLDDVTVSDIEKELGVKVVLCPEDGCQFIDKLIQ